MSTSSRYGLNLVYKLFITKPREGTEQNTMKGDRMGKKVLFTPVGGTDPISWNNMREGAILQICRHYKPDVIYLYMSAEILEKHQLDDRYLYCIRQLEQRLGHTMTCKVIERPDLTEVQQFNFFYEDFSAILEEIEEGLEQDDELLLNVSSGTPAMKSSLMVLRSLTGIPCRVIQVSTPERKMNEHNHPDESIETLWEMDLDNDPSEYVDRTEEVECPWIIANQKKDLLRTQILSYDYEAALSVHRQMPLYKDGTYVKMLEAAAKRKLLDNNGMFLILKAIGEENNQAFRPIREDKRRKVFEYAAALDVRQKRKEYGDFIRALTPLVLELFILVLNRSTNVNIESYMTVNNQNQRRWNTPTLNNSAVGNLVKNNYGSLPTPPYVYSWQILNVIKNRVTDQKICDLCTEIREIEENIRNKAAHEIIGISDEYIKLKTGCTSEEIMEKIKKVLFFTDGEAKKHWDTYNEMNVEILARMGKELGV